MPRRSTVTYSSEDAPVAGTEVYVHVYYCKYSGRHALTTDCNLARAPRRRTDRAYVIDTDKYTVKLYTSDGGVILIRRPDSKIERQYRYTVGKLPVMYKSEPEGRFLYVMNDALTQYKAGGGGHAAGPAVQEVPIPPCIVNMKLPLPTADANMDEGLSEGPQAPAEPCVQVTLSIEDRAAKATILKVTADFVRCQVINGVNVPEVDTELLEFFRGILSVRLSQLALIRGDSTRQKLLRVWGLGEGADRKVYELLQAKVAAAAAAAAK